MKFKGRFCKKSRKNKLKEFRPIFGDLPEDTAQEIRAFIYKELDMLKKQKSIVHQSAKVSKPENFLKFFNNPKFDESNYEFESDTEADTEISPEIDHNLDADGTGELPDEF